ncbi:hypothetical protein [Natrialbaceae archaeon AArc-T1-2]|uniref:hypothetical protein n=1 Tax=Natrialbaceae archaeon AArc-T1-2 TaxID=3053904 RepID=UPI00255AB913|nr:hypothetical protein [Natrialbaceae archaeon AArc-T1-2]WIV68214.1 hypothetical protein QQ977_05670 [Natrialbaceae archaeon AArc-T1-2]
MGLHRWCTRLDLAIVPGVLYLWRRRTLANAAESTARTLESDGNSTSDSRDHGNTRTIEYGDDRFSCTVVRSPNETWTVAYGCGTGTDECRAFVFREADRRFSVTTEQPVAAAIADTGHIAVLEALGPDGDAGKLAVFDLDGEVVLTHYVNAAVTDCAITADGSYAAAGTSDPDRRVYVFDVAAGELRAEHEPSVGVERLDFSRSGGDVRLELRDGEDVSAI